MVRSWDVFVREIHAKALISENGRYDGSQANSQGSQNRHGGWRVVKPIRNMGSLIFVPRSSLRGLRWRLL